MLATERRPLPPLRNPNSYSRSPEKAVMLQRYMILHSQQNSVCRRLSSSSSDPSTSPRSLAKTRVSPGSSPDMSSSGAGSMTSSPTFNGQSFSSTSPPAYALPKPAMRKASSRSPSMTPIPEDAPTPTAPCTGFDFGESQDETKLFSINADIKMTLTDLLNCEAIRKDSKMRLWVATRLMDAEQELKRQRKRRRSSTPSISLSPSEDVARP